MSHMQPESDLIMGLTLVAAVHLRLQVQEVLGAVADGVLVLQEPGAEEVLGDALRLLGSKEIKVSHPDTP